MNADCKHTPKVQWTVTERRILLNSVEVWQGYVNGNQRLQNLQSFQDILQIEARYASSVGSATPLEVHCQYNPQIERKGDTHSEAINTVCQPIRIQLSAD